jgi:hypothetical protein
MTFLADRQNPSPVTEGLKSFRVSYTPQVTLGMETKIPIIWEKSENDFHFS